MSYQVFARKYRPKTFDDLLGQDHVVRTLRNAIEQNRLAHAYLFVGPRGTGKTSTARIFAKALNCSNGPSAHFDPEEDLCREIAEGNCLDVLEIDGASNNGVDEVRDLREKVRYAPARCRFKIYYIDEVHMLSTAAFNALLKTLEEPPPHVKFLFATTEANKILPTIISRCQRFDLRRIPSSIIAKHLLHIAALEKVQISEKAAYAIAKGADGGMRDAQSMLDQLVAFCGGKIEEENVLEVFGFTAAEVVARLGQCILEQDTVAALRLVHDQSEAGKDLSRLLTDVIQHFRTLLVQQVDPTAATEDLSPEVARQVEQQATMTTTEHLLRIVEGLGDVDARMRWASNKRLHFELGIIQAVQALGEVSLSDVIEAIDHGSSTGLAPAAAPKRAAAQPPPAAFDAKPKAASASIPDPGLELAKPATAPAAASERSPEPSAVRDGDLWRKLVDEVQQQRPLLSNWMHMGTFLAIEGNTLKIGFPTSEKHACDSLKRDNQRKFLESMLERITGTSLRLDLTLDPTLKAPEPVRSEPELSAPRSEPPETPAAAKPADEFYNDPLIKAAIEKFKARILPSGSSA